MRAGIEETDESVLREEFGSYDLDKDGFIDRAEVRQLVNEQGPGRHEDEHAADAEEILKEAAGGRPLTLEGFVERWEATAASKLTDHGEILRFPEEYDFDTGAAASVENSKGKDEL